MNSKIPSNPMSTSVSIPITIYVDWASQPCRAIRRICDLNKVPSDAIIWKEVSLLKGEQFKPEFLKLNPNHTVPVLTHGDNCTLFESTVIVEYLDEIFGFIHQCGLPPRSSIQSRFTAINALTSYHNTIRPATKAVFFPVVKSLVTKQPIDMKQFHSALTTTIHTIFKPLNAQLKRNGGYLCPGGEPTAADVFGFMELWQFVKWDMANDNYNTYQIFDFEAQFPSIHSWLKSLYPLCFDEGIWSKARVFIEVMRKSVPQVALLTVDDETKTKATIAAKL